jgi:hypothetical protein
MIKITIKGASTGYDAAEWCQHNLVKEDWDMWLENAWGDYLFEFKRPQDATIFGLKWLEHT